MKKQILILLILIVCKPIAWAQTRGALPGEIYISGITYIGDEGQHYAVFYSSDNGETMTLQYENFENQSGVMWVGDVLGDATPGAIYNNYFYGTNELWVSFDYGVNWEYLETTQNTGYLSGQNNGVIYKKNGPELLKSENYGNTFYIITNPVHCPVRELGYYMGEFYGINGNYGEGLFLDHTYDYANTFSEIPIDSSVAFGAPSGHYPTLSRGTEPGELFLVSWWWPDMHYKIFHSTDTGYTWIQKFESEPINIGVWGVGCTAGRQSGSFYVFRSTYDPTFNHRLLYIDYSDDYGETFTTYFHELDSLYTSVATIHKPDFRMTAFPNPFSANTIIEFDVPENWKVPVLNIYNIHGVLIRQYDIRGKRSQQWEGRDGSGISGQKVESGIYLYRITSGRYQSGLNKIVYIKH
ncbi:MAG: T9SS type A sorting domain-containing protein [Bacteroidales bacterium]|nr:T9SS type A sorting domain-containing protein [Bacteroidales bacterium]